MLFSVGNFSLVVPRGKLPFHRGLRISLSLRDGMGAFHVVPLTKSSRPKTTFSTPFGTYHFKCMPFGLSNGPATYSRLMQMALQGIPTSIAMPYLDDTIIHSDTFTNHLPNLDLVLAAHTKAGLKLQPEKRQLFQAPILFFSWGGSLFGPRPIRIRILMPSPYSYLPELATTDRIAGALHTGAHLSSLRHCLRRRPTLFSPKGEPTFLPLGM